MGKKSFWPNFFTFLNLFHLQFWIFQTVAFSATLMQLYHNTQNLKLMLHISETVKNTVLLVSMIE